MNNRIFVTAVVDDVENGILEIIKGNTYEVFNGKFLDDVSTDGYGWIKTESGNEVFIFFKECVWQSGRDWIVEVVSCD